MKKLLMAAVSAVPFLALAQPASAQRAGDKIANSHICVFNDAVSRGNVAAEANRSARAAGGTVERVYTRALRGFAVNIPDAAVARLKANNPNIAYCEQDQILTIPPVRATAAPGFTAQAEETPWGIARVGGGVAGSYAIAWVIDTGIQPDHPDLNVNTQLSRSFIGRNSTPWDQNGHGTHVAGTIAAKGGNGIGVIGVAPGAPVVSVRVLDRRGSGTTSGVIAGVDYVAQNGSAGQVANMSLGGGASTTLDNAVKNAAATGVRFALAAGNDSANANNYSPARTNGTNIFTVSAFSIGDKWASFSNYGNPPIDYAEPGVSIKSTWLNSGYHTISGTSMATPHLAGLLLLGSVRSGGAVAGDPDGNADTIGVH